MASAGRPPLNVLTDLLLPNILLAFVIAAQVPNIARYGAFTAYAAMTVRALNATTGDALQDYSMGSALTGHLLTAVYLIFSVDPLRDFRHKHDVVAPDAMPFHRRVYWVLCIGHCPRGVGWNWQVANVPSPPQDTHRVFVRKQLLRLMRCFLLLDIAQSYIHLNPLFARSGIEARSIASQGYGMRCLSIVAWGYTPYGMITMQYSLLAAVHVGLGYSDPESWPDLFGVWRDAYTVRRFWGRTWHQLIRRFVSAYGKLACHSLGFEQGTTASSYTQLYVAFLVSGIMHSGGDLMLGPAYLGASLPFFMLQSVAISIEDGVFALANRWRAESALREVGRVVGYVWVLVWFSVSMPCYVDWAVRAGLGRSEVLPVSPIRYLYGMILRWTI